MSTKVLLVEDNEANRYLATFLLENSGFQVVHAANGIEAVKRAREQMPDIILMDIQMPEMDGYEAARLIREQPELAETPLIAVTSYAMVGDRDKAMKLGFVGYIEKPISTETFVAQICKFLPAQPDRP
jgi:two-component system, cell cycle response regulator DivK